MLLNVLHAPPEHKEKSNIPEMLYINRYCLLEERINCTFFLWNATKKKINLFYFFLNIIWQLSDVSRGCNFHQFLNVQYEFEREIIITILFSYHVKNLNWPVQMKNF